MIDWAVVDSGVGLVRVCFESAGDKLAGPRCQHEIGRSVALAAGTLSLAIEVGTSSLAVLSNLKENIIEPYILNMYIYIYIILLDFYGRH